MDYAMDDIRIMLTHNRCARAARHAPTARQPSAHIMSVSVLVSSRDWPRQGFFSKRRQIFYRQIFDNGVGKFCQFSPPESLECRQILKNC